jgi:hypothetical protein
VYLHPADIYTVGVFVLYKSRYGHTVVRSFHDGTQSKSRSTEMLRFFRQVPDMQSFWEDDRVFVKFIS